jgi:hypothetical protein
VKIVATVAGGGGVFDDGDGRIGGAQDGVLEEGMDRNRRERTVVNARRAASGEAERCAGGGNGEKTGRRGAQG